MAWLNRLSTRLILVILATIAISHLLSFFLIFNIWKSDYANRNYTVLVENMEALIVALRENPVENPQRFVSAFAESGNYIRITSSPMANPGSDSEIRTLPPRLRYLTNGGSDSFRAHHLEDPRSFFELYWSSLQPGKTLPSDSFRQPPGGAPSGESPGPREGSTPGLRPRPDERPPQAGLRLADRQGPGGRPRQDDKFRPRLWLISIKLPDGTWLNGENFYPPEGPPLVAGLIYQTGIMLLLSSLLAIVFISWTIRPLKILARAAERLGHGENIGKIPLKGVLEFQQLTSTFNIMNERIKRFVENRVKMLAVITHDLRTPITIMRLRTEALEEGEEQKRMLGILQDMQSLTEATLAFTQEESESEPTRLVDVGALIESICDDLSDIGLNVVCNTPLNLVVKCRSGSLKRGIQNLVENAVKYGNCAYVSAKAEKSFLHIFIEDEGPGIPDDKLEEVFSPFVRLRECHQLEVSGIGLGLSIAKSVIESHGGTLTLENRETGGLRAHIVLPA